MRHTLILILVAMLGPAFADAPDDARPQRVEFAMGADRIAAGDRALVTGAVAGDLILAGGEVLVVDPVAGDLIAAGGDVRIDATGAQDVYAAGGRVSLNAGVGRNARMAGGKVEVGSTAAIAGNATLAGGSVIVLGPVTGELAVAGGRVYLNSRVDGSVDASGGDIELGPEARIGGDLRYKSPAALKRSPQAVVAGTVVRLPGEMPWGERASEGLRVLGVLLAVWTLGLMLAGALCVAALPAFAAGITDTLRARPGTALILGFAVLVAVPPGAMLLMATGIGLPLALLLLSAYFAMLLAGYLAAGIALGQGVLRRVSPARAERTGWRAAAASVALLALTLVAAIPFLGWLLCFLALLAGIGTLLLQVTTACRAPRVTLST